MHLFAPITDNIEDEIEESYLMLRKPRNIMTNSDLNIFLADWITKTGKSRRSYRPPYELTNRNNKRHKVYSILLRE